MDINILTVREITQKDIPLITGYWFDSDKDYLKAMGVDRRKMPSRQDFIDMLSMQLATPYHKKKSYAVIWLVDDVPIGHSNLNPVEYGSHAYMHIHIWRSEFRKRGFGLKLIQLTLPYFFNNLELNKILCEPYSKNPSPNKALDKAGFKFIKEYVTTPGAITFEQSVNLWELKR